MKVKMEKIANVFDELDVNGDNVISVDDMKKIVIAKEKGALARSMDRLCNESGVDSSAGVFKNLDLDSVGKVLVKELIFALDEMVVLYCVYVKMDADGSGYL